jgi:hypothetical protein
MHNSIGVHMLQRRSDLVHIPPDVDFFKPSPLFTILSDKTMQVATVSQLEHQIQIVVFHERIKQTHDAGMVQVL